MEWRNRERDDASGKSLFDLAKKYRQASKQASKQGKFLFNSIIFSRWKKIGFVFLLRLLLFAWLKLINKEFSFPFLSFAVIFISKLFIGLSQIHILCL
jgi:hypothetical protein